LTPAPTTRPAKLGVKLPTTLPAQATLEMDQLAGGWAMTVKPDGSGHYAYGEGWDRVEFPPGTVPFEQTVRKLALTAIREHGDSDQGDGMMADHVLASSENLYEDEFGEQGYCVAVRTRRGADSIVMHSRDYKAIGAVFAMVRKVAPPSGYLSDWWDYKPPDPTAKPRPVLSLRDSDWMIEIAADGSGVYGLPSRGSVKAFPAGTFAVEDLLRKLKAASTERRQAPTDCQMYLGVMYKAPARFVGDRETVGAVFDKARSVAPGVRID
jgi:hypothetical protein